MGLTVHRPSALLFRCCTSQFAMSCLVRRDLRCSSTSSGQRPPVTPPRAALIAVEGGARRDLHARTGVVMRRCAACSARGGRAVVRHVARPDRGGRPSRVVIHSGQMAPGRSPSLTAQMHVQMHDSADRSSPPPACHPARPSDTAPTFPIPTLPFQTSPLLVAPADRHLQRRARRRPFQACCLPPCSLPLHHARRATCLSGRVPASRRLGPSCPG